ncbi:MAG: hypothetical protein M0D53_09915 [Flavobacterium sp. JAD_PAG50586_2]|nr:MAG: hypothetical protein M0D53_09915 [Flavobacterium sp. JAD_PAG50586_2]
MKRNILPFFCLLFSMFSFGQKLEYSTLTIPDSLKQNANAVVRLSKININISSQKSMSTKSMVVMTVLNEYGLSNLNLAEQYDKSSQINKIEATAYDASGRVVKVYKKKTLRISQR